MEKKATGLETARGRGSAYAHPGLENRDRDHLEDHRSNPSANQERNVVVQEGRDHRVPHVVVLAIDVESRCRAERRIRGR